MTPAAIAMPAIAPAAIPDEDAAGVSAARHAVPPLGHDVTLLRLAAANAVTGWPVAAASALSVLPATDAGAAAATREVAADDAADEETPIETAKTTDVTSWRWRRWCDSASEPLAPLPLPRPSIAGSNSRSRAEDAPAGVQIVPATRAAASAPRTIARRADAAEATTLAAHACAAVVEGGVDTPRETLTRTTAATAGVDIAVDATLAFAEAVNDAVAVDVDSAALLMDAAIAFDALTDTVPDTDGVANDDGMRDAVKLIVTDIAALDGDDESLGDIDSDGVAEDEIDAVASGDVLVDDDGVTLGDARCDALCDAVRVSDAAEDENDGEDDGEGNAALHGQNRCWLTCELLQVDTTSPGARVLMKWQLPSVGKYVGQYAKAARLALVSSTNAGHAKFAVSAMRVMSPTLAGKDTEKPLALHASGEDCDAQTASQS